jgi:hypothetical protein
LESRRRSEIAPAALEDSGPKPSGIQVRIGRLIAEKMREGADSDNMDYYWAEIHQWEAAGYSEIRIRAAVKEAAARSKSGRQLTGLTRSILAQSAAKASLPQAPVMPAAHAPRTAETPEKRAEDAQERARWAAQNNPQTAPVEQQFQPRTRSASAS